VAVALRSGVAPAVWLEDPRNLFTALDIYAEADREARRGK
jgi:hypothetical protein